MDVQQGVFSFDGTSILPVACKVRPWVDDDIDILNVREQACAVHVENFNEFWWFFPQAEQSGLNTRAIIYNYKEGWWSQGRMSRSAGITAAYTAQTIMADGMIAFSTRLRRACTATHRHCRGRDVRFESHPGRG